MKVQELKAKYQKSNEAKAKDKAFAKKVKLTFIIVPTLFIITYVIYNVIMGNPVHP